MTVEVNGKQLDIDAGDTGSRLLGRLDIAPGTVIAEVNGEIMKRDSFVEYEIQAGDSIELVTLVGGG